MIVISSVINYMIIFLARVFLVVFLVVLLGVWLWGILNPSIGSIYLVIQLL